MKVVISILHFNNDKDTIDCLNSILEQDLPSIEIKTYVLDNGSEKTFEVDVDKYKKIGLVVSRSRINTGFTGGHNLIYEKVQDYEFDYFLILNNDSMLEKDAISELVKSIHKEKIGAVVPKIYFTKGREFHKDRYRQSETGRVLWYAGGAIDWNNVMSRHIGVDEVDAGQFDREGEIDFATGACLLMKKEMLKKIGLFDEKYFLYYEDADLSVRMIKSGYKILYQPRAILWHNNAGSSASGSALHDYYLTRNRMIFGMKYAPLRVKVHLIKESLGFLIDGRKWQKIGVKDYFLKKFGKGSYR